jgi:glycosyltransferase involved in cell wall biosynthesis
MKIVHVSYANVQQLTTPVQFLEKISFFTGIIMGMARAHEVVSVHCIPYDGELRHHGARYRFFKVNWLQRLLPFRIHRFIRQQRPDIVIVHGLGFPWQLLLLKAVLPRRTRFFVQHHAEKPLNIHKGIFQYATDLFIDGYFFCSRHFAKDWLSAGLIRNAAKVHEVMEVSSVFAPADRSISRVKTNVQGDPAYLWVGRLDSNKDPVTLVKAFTEFLAGHPFAKLYVIFQSDSLLDDLKEIVSSTTGIVLVGKVEHQDLLHWYNSCDFIISTSHYEGSGIAVCEAMSCGCIPIVTDIPSFRMMTGEGETGLLFPPGDANALLKNLFASVNLDVAAEKQKTLSRFKNHLSFNAIVQKMEEVIRSR